MHQKVGFEVSVQLVLHKFSFFHLATSSDKDISPKLKMWITTKRLLESVKTEC